MSEFQTMALPERMDASGPDGVVVRLLRRFERWQGKGEAVAVNGIWATDVPA